MTHSINKYMIQAGMVACLMLQACTKYDTPLSVAVDKEEEQLSADDIERKVLWINIDGAVGEVVKDAMPKDGNIARLLEKSKYSWTGLVESRTSEEENEDPVTWATMLTGTFPEKHHIVDDSYVADYNVDPFEPTGTVAYYPTVINYISTANASMATLCVTPWTTLNERYLNSATRTVTAADDAETRDVVLSSLKDDDYTFTLADFSGMLNAGRKSGSGGFTAANAEYINALDTIDGYIGQFLDAIEERKNAYYEDWLVIVTSNHGGDADGHYGNTADATRNTFGIFYYSHYEPQEMKGESMYATLFSPGIQAVAYDTLGNYYSLEEDKDYTLEMIMRNTPVETGTNQGTYNIGASYPRVVGKDSYAIYRQRDGCYFRISSRTSNSSDVAIQTNASSFNDPLWHDYSAYVSKLSSGNRTYGIYYDAVNQTNGTSATLGNARDSTNFVINPATSNTDFYLSEIRVWKITMTDALAAKYAEYLDIPESDANYGNLISYWKFQPDYVVNDTIVKNQIAGMPDLHFQYSDQDTEKKVTFVKMPKTLPSYISSGNVMMENTLIVPQILYWLEIDVDSRIDGFTFLDNYAVSEEWRDEEAE